MISSAAYAHGIYQLRILSLGAGVQSTCIFLMSCKGVLPKPHLAIFADTGWETLATYQHLEWLERVGNDHGIPVVRVAGTRKDKSLRETLVHIKSGYEPIPAFSWNDIADKPGMGRRQCTYDYKLAPIKRKARALLGLRKRQRAPIGAVEMWIGISLDELRRTGLYRPDRMSHIRFPLIEWVQMERQQCIQWIANNFPGHVPPKSSCIGCPFHSDHEWRSLTNDEFADACLIDESLRNARGLKNPAFLHRSCKPLADVDLTDNQLRLFDPSDDKNSLIISGVSEI